MAQPQPVEPETRSGTTETCPVCEQRSLTAHCSSPACYWKQCTNKRCEATLDYQKGIGHALHPGGLRDPKTKAAVRIRLRWNSVMRRWRDRDAG